MHTNFYRIRTMFDHMSGRFLVVSIRVSRFLLRFHLQKPCGFSQPRNLVMWCYCSGRLFSMLIYIPVGLTTWQFFLHARLCKVSCANFSLLIWEMKCSVAQIFNFPHFSLNKWIMDSQTLLAQATTESSAGIP